MTLRRVERGWNAKGLLQPLWGRVGGRDELARIAGITGTTLSAYNSGQRALGRTNADRLAAALNVSLAELGAPEGEADDKRSLTLLARLDDLADKLGDALEEQAKLTRQVGRLQGRVRTLEAQRANGVADPKRPREAAR